MTILQMLTLILWWSSTAVAGGDPRRTPVVEAIERAKPAVVTLRVEVTPASPFLLERGPSGLSEGSGVIIDPSGLVLTNAHVVLGGRSIEVRLADGRAFMADVVAEDRSVDLALVRLVGAHDLPIIPLGSSDDLMLGEPAIAIGNPYGLGLTVSTGVVASTGRDVATGRGPTQTYIQTDAAINPGNSGGALVNIRGELIGINTFIHTAGEGIGFAIPVNRARKIAEDLLNYGEVQVPWLGCLLIDGPLAAGAAQDPGVVVQYVFADGPARRDGLQVGDVIVEFEGHRVSTRADVNSRLSERSPGATVSLVVQRGTVISRRTVATGSPPADLGEKALAAVLGISVEINEGRLVVTDTTPDGTWARARLLPGDAIVAVDGQRLADSETLVDLLRAAKARHRPWAWFTVERGGSRGTLEVGI